MDRDWLAKEFEAAAPTGPPWPTAGPLPQITQICDGFTQIAPDRLHLVGRFACWVE